MSDGPFQQPQQSQPQGGPQQQQQQQPRGLNPRDIIDPITNQIAQIRNMLDRLRDENISKITRDLSPKIDDVKSSVLALGMTLGETSPVSKPSKHIKLTSPSFYIPTIILTLIAIFTAAGFYIVGSNFKNYLDGETTDQTVVDNLLNGSMIFFAGITLSIILIFAMIVYIINSL